MSEHPQHRHLLSTVMRGMSNTASHHPRTGALHVKEHGLLLPPCFNFLLQCGEALPAVFCVEFDELQTPFQFRKRGSAHIDAEHIAKPQILAHTLMYHLLVDATS